MAHCTSSLNDRVNLPPPTQVTLIHHDTSVVGSNYGLGCSSNGDIAACTFQNTPNNKSQTFLRVYDACGQELFSAGSELGPSTWTSVPMIDRIGGVIAADEMFLIRYHADGSINWLAEHAYGRAFSPVVLGDAILIATTQGWLAAFDWRDGEFIDAIRLDAIINGIQGTYVTRNTPAVRGHRFYLSTEFVPKKDLATFPPPPEPMTTYGGLFAVDLERSRLKLAWQGHPIPFRARSGASPLVIGNAIFFDGDGIDPEGEIDPQFFGIEDHGHYWRWRFHYPLEGKAFASAAADPRGGFWIFAKGKESLIRLDEYGRSDAKRIPVGNPLDILSLETLLNETGWEPSSVISVAQGGYGDVIAMLAIKRQQENAWIMVRLAGQDSALLSYFALPRGADSWSAAQSPVMRTHRGSVVALSTFADGVYFLGDKQVCR